MNIELLEDKIDELKDERYRSILVLIIDAVREYPVDGLNDTEDYFKEIKKVIKREEITLSNLKEYLRFDPISRDDTTFWIRSSITTLLDALELMDLYKVSFKAIIAVINNI